VRVVFGRGEVFGSGFWGDAWGTGVSGKNVLCGSGGQKKLFGSDQGTENGDGGTKIQQRGRAIIILLQYHPWVKFGFHPVKYH